MRPRTAKVELDSYPRPPRGGRPAGHRRPTPHREFLSTPSVRRATVNKGLEVVIREISIHALRKEGDHLSSAPTFKFQNFYPRPPQGGRLVTKSGDVAADIFLSTPSARRATMPATTRAKNTSNFYPRPPRGGRRMGGSLGEGQKKFLSTPSARRATQQSDARGNPCRFLSTPSARRATQTGL